VAGNKQHASSGKIADTQKNDNPANLYSRKDESYITIYGWMTNRLKLSGNELLVYALIYSFTKDGEAEFHGSANYITSALNMSRRTVVSTLKSLTDNGLIKKKAAGRYCNYSVLPAQNLHTTCAEIAQVPAQNLHTTCAEIAHHIKSSSKDISKDINKNNIKSSSNEPTTTFLNFCIGHKKVQELCASIDPSWLSGTFTYPEYIAEAIEKSYQDKPQDEKTKLFIMLFSAGDRMDAFPEWRKTREAEAAAQEERNQREAAVQEKRRCIAQARLDRPKDCGHCGRALAIDGERGNCPSCGWEYFFNEEMPKWEFCEPLDLQAEFRKICQNKPDSENDMERVEKAYLLNWDTLFSQGKVKTENPIVNWNQTRTLLKNHFKNIVPEQIIKAVNKGMADDFYFKVWLFTGDYAVIIGS